MEATQQVMSSPVFFFLFPFFFASPLCFRSGIDGFIPFGMGSHTGRVRGSEHEHPRDGLDSVGYLAAFLSFLLG